MARWISLHNVCKRVIKLETNLSHVRSGQLNVYLHYDQNESILDQENREINLGTSYGDTRKKRRYN